MAIDRGPDRNIRNTAVENDLLDPREVPKLTVESQEHVGSLLELDLNALDPNYVYRWVNRAPLKVARAKAKGYKYVDPDDETIVTIVGDAPDTQDGTITVNDVVLMRVQRSVHKGRRRKIKQRTDVRLKGQEKKFRRKAAEEGQQRYGQSVEVITDKE